MGLCVELIDLMVRHGLRWRMARGRIGSCMVCWYFLFSWHTGRMWTDHGLQESIHAKHGEVSLRHDGRDSTGKHWIKCFEVCFTSFINSSLYTDFVIETTTRLVGATKRSSHHLRVFEAGRRHCSKTSACKGEGEGAYLWERGFLWVS